MRQDNPLHPSYASGSSARPIGVYDSGVGGLTVAHALAELLPHESMVYFGDTAHLPYGEKSEHAIRSYAMDVADFLIRKKCKIIVVACHSASSACYDLLPQRTQNSAKVINVIDPTISCLKSRYRGKRIGLIGTKRTVLSGIYNRMLDRERDAIDIAPLATPLLAPMIEEGFVNHPISHEITKEYLSNPALKNIDGLTLACTHYPMIKKDINWFYKHKLPIVDSSEEVALAAAAYLRQNGLLNTKSKAAKREFFVSDYTPSFKSCAHLFFGDNIQLEEYQP